MLFLLVKAVAPPAVAPRLDHGPADFTRIRCPECRWQPKRSDRWSCANSGPPEMFSGGCGQVWNTFETGGRCPGCDYQWRWTACLACRQWSLHEEWYEKDDDT